MKKIAITLLAATLLASCETMDVQTKDTIIGAGGGAALGTIIGNNVDGISKGEGAAAGAVIGGLLGTTHGKQQREINSLRNEMNASRQKVVNVPNSNGSYTPVILTETPQGYVGPRGELYPSMPSPQQLRSAYGF